MQNTIIKQQVLPFNSRDTHFLLQVTYDASPFCVGDFSFWQFSIKKINNTPLATPIEYRYTQCRGWVSQSPKFKKHVYVCLNSDEPCEDKTNIYPIIIARAEYLFFNQAAIKKYTQQIDDFGLRVSQKYQPRLDALSEQRRQLKKRVKANEIDNRQFQRLYTPIRKEKDDIESWIGCLCRQYRKRYFDFETLKLVYQVS